MPRDLTAFLWLLKLGALLNLWFLMETPIEVSQEQVDAFLGVVHANARPPQPTKNRVIVRNVVASEGRATTSESPE